MDWSKTSGTLVMQSLFRGVGSISFVYSITAAKNGAIPQGQIINLLIGIAVIFSGAILQGVWARGKSES